MDGRNLLLILLLELWHLENVSACTILVLLMLKLRQRRDQRMALDNRSFVRCETRLIYLDSTIGNSNDAWDMYVQDCANGRGAEAPTDLADVQSNNDINLENLVNENNVSPVSLNQECSQSEGSRKRKRVDETDKIVVALEKLFEESGKRMQIVTEAILKGNEDRSDIAKELKNMGLSVDDQIATLRIILEGPQNISIFKSLDDEVKAVFVQNLLMGNR